MEISGRTFLAGAAASFLTGAAAGWKMNLN
jgi:hypothetical protein